MSSTLHSAETPTMRIAIYSFASPGYDFEIRPTQQGNGRIHVSYHRFSVSGREGAPGWIRHRAEISGNKLSEKHYNRHLKFILPQELRSYDATIYIDGNIILGPGFVETITRKFFARDQMDLGLYYHAQRVTVLQELDECHARGLISDDQKAAIMTTLDSYSMGRWRNNPRPLYQCRIIVRPKPTPALDAAMQEMWALFEAHPYRDQFFMPPVADKHNLRIFDLSSLLPLEQACVIMRHRKGFLSDLVEYHKILRRITALRAGASTRANSCAG